MNDTDSNTFLNGPSVDPAALAASASDYAAEKSAKEAEIAALYAEFPNESRPAIASRRSQNQPQFGGKEVHN